MNSKYFTVNPIKIIIFVGNSDWAFMLYEMRKPSFLILQLLVNFNNDHSSLQSKDMALLDSLLMPKHTIDNKNKLISVNNLSNSNLFKQSSLPLLYNYDCFNLSVLHDIQIDNHKLRKRLYTFTLFIKFNLNFA